MLMQPVENKQQYSRARVSAALARLKILSLPLAKLQSSNIHDLALLNQYCTLTSELAKAAETVVNTRVRIQLSCAAKPGSKGSSSTGELRVLVSFVFQRGCCNHCILVQALRAERPRRLQKQQVEMLVVLGKRSENWVAFNFQDNSSRNEQLR